MAGPPQLLYQQGGANAGIYNQVLSADGLSVAPSASSLLYQAQVDGWQAGVAERPSLAFDNGAAYLIISGGPSNTGRRGIGWLRCTTASAVVVACADNPAAAPWIGQTDQVASPSGAQAFFDGSHHWLVYDALAGGSCTADACSGIRNMRLDRLCFNGDRPRTNAPTVAPQSLVRHASCSSDVASGWAASWAVGLGPVAANDGRYAAPYRTGLGTTGPQTLRQITHTSIGGSAVRVRLSNEFGPTNLQVGGATVALSSERQGTASTVRPETLRTLTFGGSSTVVIPPGGYVTSDAVTLTVDADHDLAVSLYFPTATGPPTGAFNGLETSHIGTGNLVNATGVGFDEPSTTNVFFVAAVDVLATQPAGTVVSLGDSLTDGTPYDPPHDTDQTWPDQLAERLLALGQTDLGVVNVGIGGNQLLPSTSEVSALGRLERDVLSQSGIDTVIVLIGTNDIGFAGQSSDAIIAGLEELITRADAAGVRVIGGTIPPMQFPAAQCSGPEPLPAGCTIDPGREQTRSEVNARITPGPGSLPFDAVVDFDDVLRDPAHLSRFEVSFASWASGRHPNAAGHLAMAERIELGTLRP